MFARFGHFNLHRSTSSTSTPSSSSPLALVFIFISAPARPAAKRRLWWCWILHLPCVCIACQAHSSLSFSVAHPCGGSSPAVPSSPRQNRQQPTAASSTQPTCIKQTTSAALRSSLLPVSRFFFFSRFCLARDTCCLFPAADLLVTTQF